MRLFLVLREFSQKLLIFQKVPALGLSSIFSTLKNHFSGRALCFFFDKFAEEKAFLSPNGLLFRFFSNRFFNTAVRRFFANGNFPFANGFPLWFLTYVVLDLLQVINFFIGCENPFEKSLPGNSI